jgi:prepilin signal peptidase PulO-like enzyme (type II secretory pathway)
MNFLYQIYVFIFGCLIGSFLNVVIYRLPLEKNLSSDRSVCPNCNSQLKWYHNIPVLSFLALRAKCGFCGLGISWRYPLIELATGLIAFWLFPENISSFSLGIFAFQFCVACVFLCHLFIDLDHHLLLDSLNLYLLAMILAYSLVVYPWQHWLIGGGIGLGVPLLVTWLFYKIRNQVGLGGGDIKLFGILGIYLGPTGVMFNIFLSCFVGALLGMFFIATKRMTKDKPMAFGPAILLVATLQIFFPEVSTKIQSFFL